MTLTELILGSKEKLNYDDYPVFFILPDTQGLMDTPTFVGQIDNVTAIIGEDIVLKCKVKNLRSRRVTKEISPWNIVSCCFIPRLRGSTWMPI